MNQFSKQNVFSSLLFHPSAALALVYSAGVVNHMSGTSVTAVNL